MQGKNGNGNGLRTVLFVFAACCAAGVVAAGVGYVFGVSGMWLLWIFLGATALTALYVCRK